MTMHGQQVLVVGLGASGLAMARWCARAGAQVTVLDDRAAPPHAATLAQDVPAARLLHGALDAQALAQGPFHRICISPGLAPARVAPLVDAARAHPAQVFMGDVGALALGGALGTVAVIVRQEIVLAMMGGVFVAEALSVMLQVMYFKYTRKKFGEGRRLFRMAPLHHHFEKQGWKETQVVVRFWIITMLLCLLGLSTLKLR